MSDSQKRPARGGVRVHIILIAMMAVLASCGPSTTGQAHPTPLPPTATPIHPTGPVATTPIASVMMSSANAGWGTTRLSTIPNRIAYTVDGGHTWYDVTPSGLIPDSRSSAVVYPRSTAETWAWPTSYAGSGPTTLWHTTDAGAHWATSTVATGSVMYLDCIDSMNGWLGANPRGQAAGQMPIDVWRTTDGGASWTKVGSDPVMGYTTGISFVNATTGFATALSGGANSPLMSATHDAGHTWKSVTLSVPGDIGWGVTVEPPVFTSATAGILTVTYTSNASQEKLLVYRTADAGSTWTLGPVLNLGSHQSMLPPVPPSVTASGEVFFAATALTGSITLYNLPVGASGWTKIDTSSTLLVGLTQVDFVDATHGWAITKSGLIGTTDGGVVWTVLHT